MRWLLVGGAVLLLSISWSASSNDLVSERVDDLPDVSAHSPWMFLDRNEDPQSGWVMYKREVRGSDFEAFRLEAEINLPPEVVAEAALRNLADPNVHQKNMKKTILRNDGGVTIVYSYIDMPLVSDRDVTTRTVSSHDPEAGSYRMEWHASDAGPAPLEGVVRLPQSDGSWVFTPRPGGTLAVYESHADTGGAIPAWIVNGMMNDTIVSGIDSLRARLAEDLEPAAGESTERSALAP